MYSRSSRQGFTLVELLVVVGILAVLVAILFPAFAKVREKGRQATCANNLKQLATALTTYAQDHDGKYPGANWTDALDLRDVKLLVCPSDKTVTGGKSIGYGYNALLVRPNGGGVSATAISNPAQVGAFCDSEPATAVPGLLGNAGLSAYQGNRLSSSGEIRDYLVNPSLRHRGMQIVYCDGHLQFVSAGKKETSVNEYDLRHPYNRAFVTAGMRGLVDNPGGGMGFFTATGSGLVTLWGDYSTRSLLMAAAEAWKEARDSVSGARIVSRGFTGEPVSGAINAVEGIGDQSGGTPIAKDAVVVIVAQDSAKEDATLAELKTLFQTGSSVYTYGPHSGTRRYFEGQIGGVVSATAKLAANDLDMVNRVAADAQGIGYCSLAFVDLERVKVLRIDGKLPFTPNGNRILLPSTPPDYPLVRTLAVSASGAAGSFVTSMLTDSAAPGVRALRGSPLFKSGYWAP